MNGVTIVPLCANILHHTNAMFGIISIRLLPGFYTRANAKSNKDLGDKN